MAAGFVHGVLNTDNMTVTGESFDYGPWRFAPTFEPDFTAAYFDHSGLYAFGRQPAAVEWNFARLADALRLIAPSAALGASVTAFAERYDAALADATVRRLGLVPTDPEPRPRARDGSVGAPPHDEGAVRALLFRRVLGPFPAAAREARRSPTSAPPPRRRSTAKVRARC